MSRPVVVYVGMIVVLVAGLWSVLAIGRNQVPPEDLAGKWQLTPISANASAQVMEIEQSGRFFQVHFEHHTVLDLKSNSADSSVLDGKHETLHVLPDVNPSDKDTKRLVLTGPESAQWIAHRIVRTFPVDVTSREAK